MKGKKKKKRKKSAYLLGAMVGGEAEPKKLGQLSAIHAWSSLCWERLNSGKQLELDQGKTIHTPSQTGSQLMCTLWGRGKRAGAGGLVRSCV